MGKKSLVIVTVSKTFEYPKSMLDKWDFLNDGIRKAQNDIYVVMNEMMQAEHALNVEIFKYDAREERGYRFKNPLLEPDYKDYPKNSINIFQAAKNLATNDIEQKYGVLNHEVNPHLYSFEPEIRSETGRLLQYESWYILEKIETEMFDLVQHYQRRLQGLVINR